MMRKRQKQTFIIFAVLGAIIVGGMVLLGMVQQYETRNKPTPLFGATFSTKYAQELGLDWQAAYTATLDDLGVRLLRIPVYWDEVEQQQGTLDFSHVAYMMDAAASRNARVILTIGRRVPRWPECHPPSWTKNLTESQIQQHERAMILRVVEEFKNHPALYRWQVFNEPFFSVFGECPTPDDAFIQRSLQLVKEHDPHHEIILTDSGELSTWFQTARLADVLGISMYRVTWNSFWGYFYYPLPPSYYVKKADLIKPLVHDVIVSELQAEPWVPSTILTTTLSEQYHSMNPKRLKRNIEYVRRTGFSEALLWGVEWWYWLKEIHGEDAMWDIGKELLHNPHESRNWRAVSRRKVGTPYGLVLRQKSPSSYIFVRLSRFLAPELRIASNFGIHVNPS